MKLSTEPSYKEKTELWRRVKKFFDEDVTFRKFSSFHVGCFMTEGLLIAFHLPVQAVGELQHGGECPRCHGERADCSVTELSYKTGLSWYLAGELDKLGFKYTLPEFAYRLVKSAERHARKEWFRVKGKPWKDPHPGGARGYEENHIDLKALRNKVAKLKRAELRKGKGASHG